MYRCCAWLTRQSRARTRSTAEPMERGGMSVADTAEPCQTDVPSALPWNENSWSSSFHRLCRGTCSGTALGPPRSIGSAVERRSGTALPCLPHSAELTERE